MAENKKQHYVPQCYLRYFQFSKNEIYYFSKSSGLYKNKNIGSVCQIADFYTLYNSSDPLLIEKLLDRKEESMLGLILDNAKKIVKTYNRSSNITFAEFKKFRKDIISRQIVIQYLRTPRYRESKIKNDMLSIKYEINQLLSSNKSNFKVTEIGLTCDEPEVHSSVITSEELIKNLTNELLTGTWELLYSLNADIYTSDEPVCIESFSNIPVSTCETLEYFENVYYPLNPNLAIHIYRGKGTTPDRNDSFQFKILDDTELKKLNLLIKQNARDLVFSKSKFKYADNGKIEDAEP